MGLSSTPTQSCNRLLGLPSTPTQSCEHSAGMQSTFFDQALRISGLLWWYQEGTLITSRFCIRHLYCTLASESPEGLTCSVAVVTHCTDMDPRAPA